MEESRMEGSGVWTVAGRGDRDRKKRWAQCLLDGRCCQPGLGSSPKGVSICGKVIERGPSVGWVSKGIHLWGRVAGAGHCSPGQWAIKGGRSEMTIKVTDDVGQDVGASGGGQQGWSR